jgi:hypothetical protein
MDRKKLLYIINFFLLIFSLFVIITGIIKFPGLLPWLQINPEVLPLGKLTRIHDWLGLAIVFLTLIHLYLHFKWIKAMTRAIWSENKILLILLFVIALLIVQISAGFSFEDFTNPNKEKIINQEELEVSEGTNMSPFDTVEGTQPITEGQIFINGIGNFKFNPTEIKSVRDDVFNPGYFSIFDILVYLDEKDEISLDYEFKPEFNTNVIQNINGLEDWWYYTYYDGGWAERNVWRMDLYPYKDKSFIKLVQSDPGFLESVYAIFQEEVARQAENGGKIIIPEVIIRGKTFEVIEYDVEIQPKNLRTDYYKMDTITAIDVILTLSEEGIISHELSWHESIGSAGLVKNYFVEEINGDRSVNRCGFVYETGSPRFYGSYGNHIHLPADLRVLTSQEYLEFFWICI